MLRNFTILGLGGMLAMLTAPTANADEPNPPRRTISVTGTARTSVKPDRVTIQIGVVAEARSARQALDNNNQAMNTLFQTLKQQNIAEDDIRTTGLSVNPQYGNPTPEGQGRITGYQAMNMVQVRVREIARLGAVLDTLVTAGANQVHGIHFEIGEPQDVLNELRLSAVRNARSKAQLLAQAAEAKVGKVISMGLSQNGLRLCVISGQIPSRRVQSWE